MSESVSVTFDKESLYGYKHPLFPQGEIIRVKGEKRRCLLVKSSYGSQMEQKITTIVAYKASPRSRLSNKSIFSKNKYKIVK